MNNKVKAYNIAVGSQQGSISFTSSHDTMNHVAYKNDTNIITIPVETLDGILENQPIPVLLK
jgi:hypothetical protein